MVKQLIALVDHERLTVAVARAEDQAASLALEAISGRTINLAAGIVMHQCGLAPDDPRTCCGSRPGWPGGAWLRWRPA
jgi:hypothetical protein